jgi:hypothetical protein
MCSFGKNEYSSGYSSQKYRHIDQVFNEGTLIGVLWSNCLYIDQTVYLCAESGIIILRAW